MKITSFTIALMFVSIICFGQNPTATSYSEEADRLIEKQKYAEALDVLTEGIKLMPDSAFLYDNRGTLLEAFRLFDEAIESYTIGISKTENNELRSHLYSNRGGTKFRIRDFKGAHDDLLKSVELDSTNIAAYNNLAATCEEVNKSEDVLKYLERVIEIDSLYVAGYINLGFHFQYKELHEKAIGYFDIAIQLDPSEALGFSNRSYSNLILNKNEEAMNDIMKSLELYPSNSYAYKIRALIKIEDDDIIGACKDLDAALTYGYTAQHGDEVLNLKEKYCK